MDHSRGNHRDRSSSVLHGEKVTSQDNQKQSQGRKTLPKVEKFIESAISNATAIKKEVQKGATNINREKSHLSNPSRESTSNQVSTISENKQTENRLRNKQQPVTRQQVDQQPTTKVSETQTIANNGYKESSNNSKKTQPNREKQARLDKETANGNHQQQPKVVQQNKIEKQNRSKETANYNNEQPSKGPSKLGEYDETFEETKQQDKETSRVLTGKKHKIEEHRKQDKAQLSYNYTYQKQKGN